ncbi:MAG: hypothetical protein RIS91_1964 [Bacteroidota bacterium]|jgi:hypothetical protein
MTFMYNDFKFAKTIRHIISLFGLTISWEEMFENSQCAY